MSTSRVNGGISPYIRQLIEQLFSYPSFFFDLLIGLAGHAHFASSRMFFGTHALAAGWSTGLGRGEPGFAVARGSSCAFALRFTFGVWVLAERPRALHCAAAVGQGFG